MNNHLRLELIFLAFYFINMALLTGHGHVEQKNRDYPISYTSGQLLSIRRNKFTTNLNTTTCLKIKELSFKRMFRGTRGGKKKTKKNGTKIEEYMKNG